MLIKKSEFKFINFKTGNLIKDKLYFLVFLDRISDNFDKRGGNYEVV